MDIDFWHQRWAERRLGFHQVKVNSRLKKFWRAFAAEAEPGATVLAPLCGKSLDLLWLARAGHHVIGVEVSAVACRDFFAENGLRYEVIDGARFARYVGDGGDDTHPRHPRVLLSGGDGDDGDGNIESTGIDIELWCGDWFDLRPGDLERARLVYDRAALIALPQPMRGDYAAHLAALLQPRAQVFLISMDYDERQMKGPPFSVPEAEVRRLFAADFAIDIITQSSGPDIVGNLADRGLDSLNEKVYRLRRL
ncbi:MAG: thiopurine S-methyltransferase [Gammaproteobacteria bacterium]|nr:thiopurine S-methyltransferase [Gammaproteobacteria bacterium]